MERKNLSEVVGSLMMKVIADNPPLSIREYLLFRNYANKLILNKSNKSFIEFKMNGLDLVISDKSHKTAIDIYYAEDDTIGNHSTYLQPLLSELEDILNEFDIIA
jgi:hypothetical protein